MASNTKNRGITLFGIPSVAALCSLSLGACGTDPDASVAGGIDDGQGLLDPSKIGAPASIVTPWEPEFCDGRDNDYDGEVDEEDPDLGHPCVTGQPGICSPGTLQCVWGSLRCVQNRGPEPEDCNSPEDESCDGISNCPGGLHVWSKQWNGTGHTAGTGLALDSAGNILVGADFEGAVNFGAGSLASASGHDGMVAKRDPSGNLLWLRHFGATNWSRVTVVNTDSADNVYVAGNFGGTIDFGLGPVSGYASYGNFYVVKLSPSGTTLWARTFNHAIENPIAVVADHAGNVYVSGTFWGTVDFGTGPVSMVKGADAFVVKLDSSGNSLWTRTFSGPNDQYASVMAVDSANNPVVSVRFTGSVDMGSGPITAIDYDAAIAKLDPSGNTLWSRHYGGSGYQYVGAIVDTNDDIILGGSFNTAINLGGGALTANGDDGVVARLDPSGNFIWQKHITGPGAQSASVRLDSAGNWFLYGSYSGALDYGTGPIPAAGQNDAYALKLSSTGAPIWFHRYGDAAYQYVAGAAVDAAGNFVFTGAFMGSIDFGGGNFTSVDQAFDMFLVKLAP